MADTKLQIDIEANVAAATKAIQGFIDQLGIEIKEGISIYQAFDKKIKETEQALKAASDPKAVARLTAELKSLQSGFSQIKLGAFDKGLGGVAQSSGSASIALTNLNRVVQDAPFGLIGIANNIEPLVQSFQKLKAESGGTGGALKALFSSLAGPSGILFGISAVTSAFIAFGPAIIDFIKGTDDAAKAQKTLNDELNKSKESATATGISLQGLIKIAGDETQSNEVRTNALNKLNETTNKYGITIDNLAISNGTAAAEVDKLTNALISQAVANKYADKAAELRIKQTEAIKAYSIAQKEANKEQNAFVSTTTLLNTQMSGGVSIMTQDSQAKLKNTIALRGVIDASNNYKDITKELQDVTALMVTEQQKALVVTDKKTTADKNGTTAIKKQIEAIKEVIQYRQIANELITIPEEQRQITGVVEQPPTLGQLQPGDTSKGYAVLVYEQADATKQLAEAAKDAEAAYALLSPAIDAVFNSLQQGTNVGDAVAKAIKQIVVELIKAVIQAALLNAIFSIITGGGAEAAKGAGMGFKQLFGKILGFGGRAIGGPVSGGQGYIVGENGPELFVPGTPGSIVPNMALSGAGGGNVSFEIRGDVLYGLLRRTANNKMANFG